MRVNVTMPDAEIAELARAFAARRGVTAIEAVRLALREALAKSDAPSEQPAPQGRITPSPGKRVLRAVGEGDGRMAARRQALDRIAQVTRELPLLDARPEADILGYDDMIGEGAPWSSTPRQS